MKKNWLIIPDFERREESAKLAQAYDAGFEYNDFFQPYVYENDAEIKRRVEAYKALDRDRSNDTLHGAFLDVVISSDDAFIAEYSKKRLRQSMDIGRELSVKGVVFHSGLVPGVTTSIYLNNWLERQEAFYREICRDYPEITVYLENTQEYGPKLLLPLIERMSDCQNFRVCLDYAHAAISKTPVEDWVTELGPYIDHMHVNDNDLKVDLHQTPGEGKIDWWKYALLTAGFKDASVLVELGGIERQRKALEYLTSIE
jgi:sugar phosphate isomerase/epimerase